MQPRRAQPSAMITVVAVALSAGIAGSVRFVDRDADEDRMEKQARRAGLQYGVFNSSDDQDEKPSEDSEGADVDELPSLMNSNETFSELPNSSTNAPGALSNETTSRATSQMTSQRTNQTTSQTTSQTTIETTTQPTTGSTTQLTSQTSLQQSSSSSSSSDQMSDQTTVSTGDNYDCGTTESNWQLGWSRTKKTWCCQKDGSGCSEDRPAFNCSSALANWGEDWSMGKKEWCCEHESVGCVANCSTFVCSGDCSPVDCAPRSCQTDECTSDECCNCVRPPADRSPCPTESPSPCPSPEPTAMPTPLPSHIPTPLPTHVPSPVPTPVPSPCPTPVTPDPTPAPTPPVCSEPMGCDLHQGVCYLDKYCAGNWSCGCGLGYRCVGNCNNGYENCHTPRECERVLPTPRPTPIPTQTVPPPDPVTPEPTPEPTPVPPTPSPTFTPTLRPTPRPTLAPTPKLSNETHGCKEGSPYGEAYEDCDCPGGWQCGCRSGYECVSNCDGCHTPRVCSLTTPSPTPSPTPAPTMQPTPEPTPWPTETEPPSVRPTPLPTRWPTPRPTLVPTRLPTFRPTPQPTYESCDATHNCNVTGGGACLLKSACSNGWTCSCQQSYQCVKDCVQECLERPRGCLVAPTPAPTVAPSPPHFEVTCSGWSPSSGSYRNMGQFCSFWGSIAVKWCFVGEDYHGYGMEHVNTAEEFLRSSDPDLENKYIVKCDGFGCSGFTCPDGMSLAIDYLQRPCNGHVCRDSECCVDTNSINGTTSSVSISRSDDSSAVETRVASPQAQQEQHKKLQPKTNRQPVDKAVPKQSEAAAPKRKRA